MENQNKIEVKFGSYGTFVVYADTDPNYPGSV